MGMTVCIGAINAFGDIVTASDQMLSMADGSFTAESVALKDLYINSDWRALFAGEDVSVLPGLMRRIGSHINWGDQIGVEKMTEILAESFQAERRARATELYLTPFGITLPEFMSNGAALFGESEAGVIRERIASHRLGCELLVAGHDGDPKDPIRRAHLLSVTDPGVVKDHSKPGFWAIGTGWYLAMSSLALRGQCDRYHTHRTIFHVCEAKFLAEAAVGVGRSTTVMVHKPNRSWAMIMGDDLKALRKEWERIGKPRDPTRATSKIEAWAKAANWHNESPVKEDQESSPTSSSNDQT